MFDESHQFVSEVLEIQDKFQHVCRIVSIRIKETCLDMFDESHQFVLEVLKIQDKFQHIFRVSAVF
jgi:hypothetical protein